MLFVPVGMGGGGGAHAYVHASVHIVYADGGLWGVDYCTI